MRPRLLDLYSGAGGAAMGYYRAGFDVTGVDIEFQKHYPCFHDADYAKHFHFIQGDALEYIDQHGREYDAIHASPPCQFATLAGQQWRSVGKVYPNLIQPTRVALQRARLPYVIENVPGAPLIDPIILNGAEFKVRRTRLFECSFYVPFRLRHPEAASGFRMGRKPTAAGIITPVGHFSGVKLAAEHMGVPWMNQAEVAQAIPVKFTEWIGEYLMRAVLESRPVGPEAI